MTTELCNGEVKTIWVKIKSNDPNYRDSWSGFFGIRPEGVKRLRLKCPKCGRKIMSSVLLESDGQYYIHMMPPHNPKGWWKRHNKRKEKSRQIRPR